MHIPANIKCEILNEAEKNILCYSNQQLRARTYCPILHKNSSFNPNSKMKTHSDKCVQHK